MADVAKDLRNVVKARWLLKQCKRDSRLESNPTLSHFLFELSSLVVWWWWWVVDTAPSVGAMHVELDRAMWPLAHRNPSLSVLANGAINYAKGSSHFFFLPNHVSISQRSFLFHHQPFF